MELCLAVPAMDTLARLARDVAPTVVGDPTPVDELQVPLAINLVAVTVGAIAGTLRAADEREVDVVGMFTLAMCGGFGGSLVRDLLLGNLPPVAFRTPSYIVVVLLATVVGSVFVAYLDRLERPLWVMDSLSIGLFAAVGTNAALLADLTFLPAAIIGTVASVGGLMLADGLQARPSTLLYRGPPVVLAGGAGALVYVLLYDVLAETVVTVLAVAAAFAIRIAGYFWDLHAPSPIRERLGLRSRVRRVWRRLGANPPTWHEPY